MFGKSFNSKIVICFWLSICVAILSCCKTTEKKPDENKNVEENVVTEISNSNSPKRIDSNVINSIEPVPSLKNQSPTERINVVYKDMIQDIKEIEGTYSAAYTVQDLSSGSTLWLESLSDMDNEKYFYATGVSEVCKGRSTAKRYAEVNAEKKLKDAAIKISGKNDIDVRSWELLKVHYKKLIDKDGHVFYTARVLIGIDRNLVVKN